jgi:hypothetical protein
MAGAVGVGGGGVATEGGGDQGQSCNEQRFDANQAGLAGLSDARRRLTHFQVTVHCYVRWLKVGCGPRNTDLRQNYNRIVKS